MRYAHPGTEGAIVSFKAKYGNYIGGEFVAPIDGTGLRDGGGRVGHACGGGGRRPVGDLRKRRAGRARRTASPTASRRRHATRVGCGRMTSVLFGS